jgi:exodeoxyribonuclease VII large subunit
MFKTEQTYLTLSEYLSEIREVIQDYFFDYQWITAEIADIKSDKNGRYWFTLVEKKEDEIIAQIDAVLWKGEIVNNFFMKTGINLQKGLKILFSGRAVFHEKYGLKINIYQIDPSYTLGELALMKKEVIERLKKEGLIDKNKENIIPPVIQRIAVISSKRAAGYEDFLKILGDNARGYKFSILFYDVFVQGQEAVTTIINALKMCSAEAKSIDSVVIIRGGGSTVDLQCFNEYELAKNIALLPIPVLTGIGHTRDETVADIVAFRSFKTPSEVAKFILDRAFDFENKIEQLRQSIYHHIESFMKLENANNLNILLRLKTSIKNSIEKLRSNLNNTTNALQNNILKEFQTQREKLFSFRHNIHQNARIRIKEEEKLINSEENKIKLKISSFITQKNFEIKNFNKNLTDKTVNLLKFKNLILDRFEEKLHLLSPENILKRGYSIAYINGKAIKTTLDIKIGDKVDIHLYKGKFSSIVTEKEDLDGKT